MGEATVLRTPPSKVATLQIWFGAVYLLAVLALAIFFNTAGRESLMFYALAPLGLLYILQGTLRKSARVELEPTGLRIYNGRSPRGRSVAWSEVQSLRMDPPGGPRVLRLTLLNGRDVDLPLLEDADNGVLVDAHRVATGHPG